jgi:putative transposase
VALSQQADAATIRPMVPVQIQLETSTLRKVLKRLHFPLEIMLVCVRWYAAYPLSLRNLEEMMAERGVAVDHATVHRWALKILPVFAKVFRRRKRPVGRSLEDGRDLVSCRCGE